jgi:Zn-dependent metalloprotease
MHGSKQGRGIGAGRLVLAVGALVAAGAGATAFAGCSTSPSSQASSSSQPPGGSPPDAAAQLLHDTGVPWYVHENPRFHTPTLLRPLRAPPVWLAPGTSPSDGALAFLKKYEAIFGIGDPSAELVAESSGGPDAHGVSFANFTQVSRGIPVLGTRLTVLFDGAGRVALVTGLFSPAIAPLSSTPGIDAAAATAHATADMTARFGASALANPLATPAPTLLFDPASSPPALAFHVVVSYDAAGSSPPLGFEYVIDAQSGAVLAATPAARSVTQEIPGSGAGILKDVKGFPVAATPGPVAPYLMETFGTPTSSPEFLCSYGAGCPNPLLSMSPTSWDTAPPDPGSAVDGYAYAASADAFWRSLGLSVVPLLQGGVLGVSVHDPAPGAGGAYFWAVPGGDDRIHIAPSAVSSLSAAAALDALGHEFTHILNHLQLQFVYLGESATVDESLADIMGQYVEAAHLTIVDGDGNPMALPYTSDDGILGEAVSATGRRSLRAPPTLGFCDNAEPGLSYSCAPNPSDAHANCGIGDNAWYLTTYGGQNVSSLRTVDPAEALGPDGTLALYASLYQRKSLDGFTDFSELALNLVNNEMIFTDAWYTPTMPPAVHAVACAWYAVGVFTDDDLEALSLDPCTPDGGKRPSADAAADASGDAPSCATSASAIMTGANNDNGAAAAAYCLGISASLVGGQLGLGGLGGPIVLSSQTNSTVAGNIIEATCGYTLGDAVVATVGFTNAPIPGTADIQFSQLAGSSLASAGCAVSPAPGGAQALSAACPCPGAPDEVLIIDVDGETLLIISAQTTVDNEEALAAAILSKAAAPPDASAEQ